MRTFHSKTQKINNIWRFLKQKNTNSERGSNWFVSFSVFFDPSAFDFLEGKGKQEEAVDIRRTSLLLRFDPLCQQPKSVLNNLREEEPIPENELKTVTETEVSSNSPGIQITTKSVKVS